MKIEVNNFSRTIGFRPLKPKVAVPSQIQLIIATISRNLSLI